MRCSVIVRVFVEKRWPACWRNSIWKFSATAVLLHNSCLTGVYTCRPRQLRVRVGMFYTWLPAWWRVPFWVQAQPGLSLSIRCVVRQVGSLELMLGFIALAKSCCYVPIYREILLESMIVSWQPRESYLGYACISLTRSLDEMRALCQLPCCILCLAVKMVVPCNHHLERQKPGLPDEFIWASCRELFPWIQWWYSLWNLRWVYSPMCGYNILHAQWHAHVSLAGSERAGGAQAGAVGGARSNYTLFQLTSLHSAWIGSVYFNVYWRILTHQKSRIVDKKKNLAHRFAFFQIRSHAYRRKAFTHRLLPCCNIKTLWGKNQIRSNRLPISSPLNSSSSVSRYNRMQTLIFRTAACSTPCTGSPFVLRNSSVNVDIDWSTLRSCS